MAWTHYGTKWWEIAFSDQNTFPQLHDAPLVPEDLNCLKTCFDVFQKDPVLLRRIQRQCSRIGLDRQIPTHVKEGDDLVNSGFSFILPYIPFNSQWLPLPWNPNMDCLMFYSTEQRQACRSGGVCNYLANQGAAGNTVSNSRRPKQFDSSIETNITKIDPADDFKKKILRASSPVERAIALCAQAKANQWARNNTDLVTLPELSDSEQTCDSFMPDIFGSLCSCVGSCSPRNFDPANDTDSNLILHFHTDQGLWGCQDACKQTGGCEFYTHSKLSYFEEQTKYAEIPASPVFHCFLWRKCDSFFIPNTRPNSANEEDPFQATDDDWLDLRSGPKDCSLLTQNCPIVKSVLGTLESLPPGYTLQTSCQEGGADTTCGFEVRNCLKMLSSCTLTLIFPWYQGDSSPWTPTESGRKRNGLRRKGGKSGKKQDKGDRKKDGKKGKKQRAKGKGRAGKATTGDRVLGSSTTSLSIEKHNRCDYFHSWFWCWTKAHL